MEIVASFHIPVRVRRRGAVRIPWTSIFNWSGWLAILAIPVIFMVHDSISRGRQSAALQAELVQTASERVAILSQIQEARR